MSEEQSDDGQEFQAEFEKVVQGAFQMCWVAVQQMQMASIRMNTGPMIISTIYTKLMEDLVPRQREDAIRRMREADSEMTREEAEETLNGMIQTITTWCDRVLDPEQEGGESVPLITPESIAAQQQVQQIISNSGEVH